MLTLYSFGPRADARVDEVGGRVLLLVRLDDRLASHGRRQEAVANNGEELEVGRVAKFWNTKTAACH